MNIVFVSVEVAPYSKAGGLADVAGSLPQALAPYVNAVQVLTPLYSQIDRIKYDIQTTAIKGKISLGKKIIPYALHQTMDIDGKTKIGFIECDQFFGRDGIYTESDGEGFADNNLRYFFFQMVVLDLISSGSIPVDILHCNDHHTGLLPLMMKTLQLKVRTIFTIHNFLYHGHFSAEELNLLPGSTKTLLTKTQWDNYSALLEGIDHSDIVTTVSPGYALELLAGLNVDVHSLKRIQAVKANFSGIVNGIDTEYWSPERDQYIPFHFSKDDLDGKRKNKAALLAKVGLAPDMDAPLLGSISRLVENKGFPLINKLLDEFVELGAKFIFLGSGSPEITDQLRKASKRHPQHIAFDDGFNEPLAHLIEAGSDMFLMPSRLEPCGLNQLYSLRYGTIPIVHRTGGLGDTVDPWTADSGTGFVFEPYDINELRKTMGLALKVYHSGSDWVKLMQRAMSMDFSWDQSAKQYFRLYNL
ncbi:MAG: glycogen synthase [FCB group bacterium]|nr:glycogen synthase [FCB group bacterium]MBL7029134.1 glycogen synthase [Candidatus Neomarinimicrobiota bacterium]MBL7122045.1 glycogen synthase [Candidatus Neomarinimicrobiota bacterium]